MRSVQPPCWLMVVGCDAMLYILQECILIYKYINIYIYMHMHISIYTHIYIYNIICYIYTDIIIAELRLSEYNEKELKARKPTE